MTSGVQVSEGTEQQAGQHKTFLLCLRVSTAGKCSLLLKTHPTMPIQFIVKENTALRGSKVFEHVYIA